MRGTGKLGRRVEGTPSRVAAMVGDEDPVHSVIVGPTNDARIARGYAGAAATCRNTDLTRGYDDAVGEAIGAYVLRPNEGRRIDLGGFGMTVKATDDHTRGAFTLLEAEEPAGFGPPLHIHHNADEAFYVLDGEYRMFIEDREEVCPAGSFVFIPAGMRHGFRVGDRPSRKLNLYAPAAMLGYFDDLSAALAAGVADPDALAEIAMRYGMEVVGPVPEGYL